MPLGKSAYRGCPFLSLFTEFHDDNHPGWRNSAFDCAVVYDVIQTPTLLRQRIRILASTYQSVRRAISFDVAKRQRTCRMPAYSRKRCRRGEPLMEAKHGK